MAKCCFMLGCLLVAGLAHAQTGSSSLAGTVTDSSKAPVPLAQVVVKQVETGVEFKGETNSEGYFVFTGMPTGEYSMSVEKTGFKKSTRGGINLLTANRGTIDVVLEVGDVSQSIEVSDTPPLLQTQSGEQGTNFQPKFMRDGPLFVSGGLRTPQNFISFMPGVNNGFQEGSITGSSRRSQEILIDGASNVDTESGGVSFQFGAVEQFGEFKLLTNTFSAEYGRTGGGIQIYTTKSGTNELHGSGFNFFRNDALDATAWATTTARRFPEGDTRNPAKGKVRQNEWGFNAGGPVVLPKIYDGRNKTFFYFTFNGFDQPTIVTNGTGTVPTANMRNGDFSEWAAGIFDPATEVNGVRQMFPGNRIPSNRFSAVASKINALLPAPSSPGLLNNYITTNLRQDKRRLWSIKGDHMISDKQRLSGFLSYTSNVIFTEGPIPGPFTTGSNSRNKPEVYRANHSYTATPNLVNNFTFGFTRFQNFVELPDSVNGKDWPGQLGLRGVETGTSASFPNITWGTGEGLNALGTLQNRSGTFNWVMHVTNGATWVKGKHELKIGGELRRSRTLQDPPNDAQVQGVFNFDRFQTAANNGAQRTTTGHSYASFLLGQVNTGLRTFNAEKAGVDARYGHQALYFNDTWRATSKLTLTLGIRWDVGLAREDRNGTQASLNPTGINAAAGGQLGTLIFVGDNQPNSIGRSRFGKVYLTDFGPRLNFAYSMNPKTVIRGGYGIFYAPSNGLIGGGCFPCTFGVSATPSVVSNSFNQAFPLDGGFVTPAGFVQPPTFAPDAFNFNNLTLLTDADGLHARVNNWSFNIQRELPMKLLLDVAYIGHYTNRLNARAPVNQVDPKFLSLGALLQRPISSPEVVAAGFRPPYVGFPATQSLAQALRPFPQFLNIGQNYSGQGSARYNGMILKLERRFSDFSLLGSYTFSRAQMYRGSDSSNCGCINPQDSYNYRVERSLHTNDIPHVINVIYTYDLPFGRGKKFLNSSNGLVNGIVRGWTIAGAHQYRAGTLVRPTTPNGLAGVLFNGELRPNVVGGDLRTSIARTSLDPSDPNTRWFTPGTFAAPGAFSFGNANAYYNPLRNPPVFVENFGLSKRTYVKERLNFEIRADISNPLNRTNFGGIVGDVTNPSYGRPTGPQVGARIIQMLGRVNF